MLSTLHARASKASGASNPAYTRGHRSEADNHHEQAASQVLLPTHSEYDTEPAPKKSLSPDAGREYRTRFRGTFTILF